MTRFKKEESYNVPMLLLRPMYETVLNETTKKYPNHEEVGDEFLFYGSFKTYGGTESTVNGIYTILDTAIIQTWFDPSISSDCRIYVIPNGKTYDIENTPENIGMRNRLMQFKVKRIGGTP